MKLRDLSYYEVMAIFEKDEFEEVIVNLKNYERYKKGITLLERFCWKNNLEYNYSSIKVKEEFKYADITLKVGDCMRIEFDMGTKEFCEIVACFDRIAFGIYEGNVEIFLEIEVYKEMNVK